MRTARRVIRHLQRIWRDGSRSTRFLLLSSLGYWVLWGAAWFVSWTAYIVVALVLYSVFVMSAGVADLAIKERKLQAMRSRHAQEMQELMTLLEQRRAGNDAAVEDLLRRFNERFRS